MANDYSFHVRNAHPGDMVAALSVLQNDSDLSSEEIVTNAEALGFTINDRVRLEALITVRELGFVEKSQNHITQNGRCLLKLESLKPELFPDVVHGLQYGLWDSTTPGENCFSWTYRSMCQQLWVRGNATVDRREMASILQNEANEAFQRNDIALSNKSIGGILLWLEELQPSVIGGDKTEYSNRDFCAPELFLLAVDYVFRSERLDYGTNMLLSDEQQEAVCQMCLIDIEAFERVLQYAVLQFGVLEKGIGGGWGYYLTLQEPVSLEDLI